MVQVEVVKTGSESAMSLIRKFTRRSQSANTVRGSRDRRYSQRSKSKAVTKKRTLKKLVRQRDYRLKIKEGKIAEPAPRRGSGPQREHAPRTSQTTGTTGSGLGEATPIAR
jgi:hypothetical protein